jgi:hypothetical protein
LLGEVTQKLTQRLGTVKDGAAREAVNLPQKLVLWGHANTCNAHVTRMPAKVTDLESYCKSRALRV